MTFASYTQFYRDREKHGIEYAASHAASLGFDGVEYFTWVGSDIFKSAGEERTVLERFGLKVTCYSVGVCLFGVNTDEIEEKMMREIEAAATLGSPYFHHTIFPSYFSEETTSSYEEVFCGIVELAERIVRACNERGMVCLYEPQGRFFNGVDGLERLVLEMEARGCLVGVCGDFGNPLFVDVDPREVFDRFADRIRHVHAKDYLVTEREMSDRRTYFSRSGKRIYETAVGGGSVDFAYGFRVLKSAGWDGVVSLELDGSDKEILETVRYLKQMAGQ